MQRAFRHRMELHVLGKRAVGGAADVDHNDRVHEKAGVQHLHQRLLLDVDREGLLTVAVDDGGDAACPTHGAGGSLSRPLARLGRQRKLFAHMQSEEHTSELQSIKSNSYDVYCLKK